SARQSADTSWNLLAPLDGGDTEGESAGSPWEIEIQRFSVGDVSGTARKYGEDSVTRVEDFKAAGGPVRLGPDRLVILDTLGARIQSPVAGAEWTSVSAIGQLTDRRLEISSVSLTSDRSRLMGQGTLLLPDDENDVEDIDFGLRATPLVLGDLRPFIEGLKPEEAIELEASIRGESRRVTVSADARSLSGGVANLSGSLTPLLDGPVDVDVTASVSRLELGRLLESTAVGGMLDGTASLKLAGDSLTALNGLAEGTFAGLSMGSTTVQESSVLADFREGTADLDVRALLDSIELSIAGSVAPFGADPAYDLALSLNDVTAAIPAMWGPGRSVSVEAAVNGRGFTPEALAASGRLQVRAADRTGDLSLKSLNLIAEAVEGSVEASVRGDLLGGQLDGAFDFEIATPVAYRLHRATFQDLDLGMVASGGTPSSLSGTLTLSGTGPGWGDLVQDAHLELLASSYGSVELDSLEVVSRLDGPRARVTVSGYPKTGEVVGTLTGSIERARGRLSLENGQATGIDLGEIFGAPGLRTHLTAQPLGAVEWTDGEPLQSDLRLQIDPSTFNDWPVVGGSVETELRDGVLTLQGAMSGEPGELTVQAEVTNEGSDALLVINEARFEDVDVGRLLGTDRVQTGITGVLQARVAGGDGELRAATGELRLDGSAIQNEQLARLRAGLTADGDGYRLQGEARGQAGDLDVEWSATGSFLEGGPSVDALVQVKGAHLERVLGIDVPGIGTDITAEITASSLDPDAMVAQIRLDGQAGVADAQLDSLQLSLAFADGRLTVDNAIAGGNVGTASAQGSIALRPGRTPSHDSLTFAADLEYAGTLSQLLSDTVSLRGASMRGAVTGSAEERTGVLSLSVDGSRLGGIESGPASLVAEVELDETWRPGLGNTIIESADIVVGAMSIDSLKGSVRLL
ncbi:MAG: hypothetical protein ACR2QM_12235, partial [Longimicrobiales bacterium]